MRGVATGVSEETAVIATGKSSAVGTRGGAVAEASGSAGLAASQSEQPHGSPIGEPLQTPVQQSVWSDSLALAWQQGDGSCWSVTQ